MEESAARERRLSVAERCEPPPARAGRARSLPLGVASVFACKRQTSVEKSEFSTTEWPKFCSKAQYEPKKRASFSHYRWSRPLRRDALREEAVLASVGERRKTAMQQLIGRSERLPARPLPNTRAVRSGTE